MKTSAKRINEMPTGILLPPQFMKQQVLKSSLRAWVPVVVNFLSWVIFYFSFLSNALAYINIPRNKRKRNIGWDKKKLTMIHSKRASWVCGQNSMMWPFKWKIAELLQGFPWIQWFFFYLPPNKTAELIVSLEYLHLTLLGIKGLITWYKPFTKWGYFSLNQAERDPG